MDNLKKINDILVTLFNVVLKLEEKAIQGSTRGDLSITEIHTLVAIGQGRPKTMSQVANSLKVNVSTLTTAINKLVKKGYVNRFRIPEDRRIVKIELTQNGKDAVAEHEGFHMAMIADAIAQIPESEVETFITSLNNINQYVLARRHPPIQVEGPFQLKPIKLAGRTVPVPIFQGALSVGLSMSPLAAAVSKQGGVGVIAASKIGYREEDFSQDPLSANIRVLKQEIRSALEMVKDCENRGPIGVNVMWSAKHRKEYVKAAVEAGAEVIVCGAGIPSTLPAYCKDKKVALVPIVASKRAAAIIIRNWAKKYNRTPDAFIYQGPMAGGYLGIKEAQIDSEIEDFYKNISDIKGELEDLSGCPLIVGGGIFSREDAANAYAYGADGMQIGTRFVATRECSAGKAFKEAYLNCKQKDVTLITSPEGFPGRVMKNDYSEKAAGDPGCITYGLINAARDNMDEGLIFCGGKVEQVKKIERVADIFREFIK